MTHIVVLGSNGVGGSAVPCGPIMQYLLGVLGGWMDLRVFTSDSHYSPGFLWSWGSVVQSGPTM